MPSAPPISILPKCRRCRTAMIVKARSGAEAPRRFMARCPGCGRVVKILLAARVLNPGRDRRLPWETNS